MPRTILKYALMLTGSQPLLLPEGAEILTVQTVNGAPHLWVLGDLAAPDVARVFALALTGADVDFAGVYLGTFQRFGSPAEYHLFEVPQP